MFLAEYRRKNVALEEFLNCSETKDMSKVRQFFNSNFSKIKNLVRKYRTRPVIMLKMSELFYLKLLEFCQTLLTFSVSESFGNCSRTKFFRVKLKVRKQFFKLISLLHWRSTMFSWKKCEIFVRNILNFRNMSVATLIFVKFELSYSTQI